MTVQFDAAGNIQNPALAAYFKKLGLVPDSLSCALFAQMKLLGVKFDAASFSRARALSRHFKENEKNAASASLLFETKGIFAREEEIEAVLADDEHSSGDNDGCGGGSSSSNRRGEKTYITNIENELSDKNVKGIILLGAPENTHKAIARMQDSWGGALPYPVFSFFSQDDIIAMEDSADFVLDKAQKAEINGILEEEEQTYIKEIPYPSKNNAPNAWCSRCL